MHLYRPHGLAVVLAACLLVVAVCAASQPRSDPATVTLATDLRRSPGGRSAVLATLSAGRQVRVLEMRGDEARVDAGGTQGWIPLSKLRLGDAGAASTPSAGNSGGSLLRGLSGLLGGGTSGSGSEAKVPIGVRGLTREDVATAIPDAGAVQRMESYRVSPQQALAFAREAGLEAVDVDYAAPTSVFSAPARGASGGGDR